MIMYQNQAFLTVEQRNVRWFLAASDIQNIRTNLSLAISEQASLSC